VDSRVEDDLVAVPARLPSTPFTACLILTIIVLRFR
jgi:hypothetical protein